MADIKNMAKAATATVSLAIATLVGIAVISGFKDTLLVDNTTADNFITGLAIFGIFMAVITLTIVGKIILGLVKESD